MPGTWSSKGVRRRAILITGSRTRSAKKIASGARYDGLRRAGQLGIETIGLRTEKLRKRMDAETDRQQLEGTRARIAIGKHRDDFGTLS